MNLTHLLNIDLPIIQAPMAGSQGSALAIAVCNSGALGSLPSAMLSPEALRAELGALRAQTDKPYNVNFFCHTSPVPDAAIEARWRASLAPYYEEFGIDANNIVAGPARMPFDHAAAELLSEFKPKVISFHFGLPSNELLAQARSWGAKILSSATTVAEALWLEQHGVDMVIAQGYEAGGHRGMFLSDDLNTQLSTLALLPQIVRAIRVPVIAAGGIADAAGVAAVMQLGAAGAQLGTAYLLCNEATTSAVHRAALQSEAAACTAVTNLFTGRPARGIVNRFMREQGPMNAHAPAFPLAAAAVTPIRAKAEAKGSGEFSPLWAGQNVSGCRNVSARDITLGLAGKLSGPA